MSFFMVLSYVGQQLAPVQSATIVSALSASHKSTVSTVIMPAKTRARAASRASFFKSPPFGTDTTLPRAGAAICDGEHALVHGSGSLRAAVLALVMTVTAVSSVR